MSKRAIIIVLDSCGVGALPDASEYGDAQCNTLGNIARHVGGLKLPNLEKLGLGNIIPIEGVRPVGRDALASWGKAAELSKGKDTTTGHYEIAGIVVSMAFPTYPKGFPSELIKRFCEVNGFERVLGNKTASGTEIIKELGEEHLRTGQPIVYTSADSVFQIAAHEDVIPPERLWEMCARTARLLTYPHNISRVIARPFIGRAGNFTRTMNRRDFTQDPPSLSLLDHLKESGHKVYGIGKIEDIFNNKGLTKSSHTKNDQEGISRTIEAIKNEDEGLIFTNLVDFDMKYGHRNDPAGYAKALAEFDERLPDILEGLKQEDLLMIIADHGCDPTYLASTDHSREYVPILACGRALRPGCDLGTRRSFADIGMTVADYFGISGRMKNGTSFLSNLLIS